MNKPRFSVITCVYNREKFLQKCLDSVKSQDFKDFEHVIVYGYSTDKTLDVINRYKQENPTLNIKVIETEAKGISHAMNLGITSASGEIISFVHSDDFYISPSVLTKVDKLFKENKDKLWLFGNITRSIHGKLYKIALNKFFTKTQNFPYKIPNIVSHDNSFMKKEIFNKYGLFSEKYKVAMDYEFFVRIDSKDKPLVINDSFVACIMHKNSASMGFKNKHKLVVEVLKAMIIR